MNTDNSKSSTVPSGALGPRRAVPIPPDAIWICAKQVCQRYGGRSTMWLVRKLQNDPDFPKPTYFGRLQFFRLEHLEAYDRMVIAQNSAA
jgi:hypothetical protein